MQKEWNDPYVKVGETMVYPDQIAIAGKLLKRVADRILSDTTYQFRNRKTGETSDKPGLWSLEETELVSGYNDWKYWNGVIHLAMINVAKVLEDDRYLKYIRKNYAFSFKHMDFFQKQFEAGVPDCNFHQFFRLDRLDDFGAMAAGLLALNPSHSPAMEDYIKRVSEYISKKQDRLEDNTFCRKRFNTVTLWADDLFMSIPFLVQMFARTGDEGWLKEAILQSVNFHARLFNRNAMVYHHCWYGDTGQHGAAFWSRANGWVMMARVMLMDALPSTHPYRNELEETILQQVVGLSRYQSESGLWHQLIDKPDSFPETSGTAMFIYGIARSVNEGWIPEYYTSVALRAWEGITEFVNGEGELDGVSTGFNIRQDLPYYYGRPIEKGGAHGIGAFMLAAAEVSRLKPYRDCVWC